MATNTQREGSRGPAVVQLQNMLNSKGFPVGAADGAFGPKTKRAVIAFQRANGLAADGIVGPKTWAALGASGATLGATHTSPQHGQGTAAAFVEKALAQSGDKYRFGAEASPNDPNPKEFDCSELVEWAASQVGVKIPDGTMNQLPHIKRNHKTIPVAQAINTRGALLFKPGHVAISLGDGRTIEAKGRKHGVGIFSAHKSKWTAAGLIPGMKY